MIKTFKLFALIIFIFSSLAVFSQEKVVYPIKPKDFDGLGITNDFKVLAEGSQSKVESPFVFIARDEKTYAQLQNLVEGLPAASTIDFKKNAVVAGFAGERSTGGWSVEIRKAGKRVLIDLKSPPKGSMTTQVITYPFKVSLIPLDEGEALPLDFTTSYAKNSKTFQVTKGDFEYSGGFAGIRKKFKVNGTIQILTFGDFTTVLFNLKGTGKEAKRKLSETVSGTLKNGNIELARLDAGSFVENPHPPFGVKGMLKGKNLSLNFDSLPTTFADGFEGKGSLEAILVK